MTGPSDSLRFSLANPADDADLRRLLREQPMDGAIRVGFAREPSYFSGTSIGEAEDRTLIAREGGHLVATGRCVIQRRWLNGQVRRCAYLGELRLGASVRGRWDILRRGYACFAGEYARAPADFCFTSIVGDNHRARRLLERGIAGMPRYEPLGDFTTLLLRTRNGGIPDPPAGMKLATGEAVPLAQLAEFLNTCGRERNLALHWTPELILALGRHGLNPRDFFVLLEKGNLAGCVAVWDQRSFRQVIVHGYESWLTIARPLANLLGIWFGWPGLPAPGAPLAHAFLSPLALDPRFTHLLPLLIEAGRCAAARRGNTCVALGTADGDERWRDLARAFRGRRYASRLYAVHWPGMRPAISGLDARPCMPELALL